MTTWNNLPDAEIDAESPLTEDVMFRLRDNARAVAEGDPSVPDAELVDLQRQRTTSLDDDLVFAPDGTGKIQLRRGENNRSPYSLRTLGVTLDAMLGKDGAIVALGAGGAFFATTVTISAPQAPTKHVYIFATGDVAINDDIIMPGFDLEINTPGNITLSNAADIEARSVRLFAGGGITDSGAGIDCDLFQGVFAARCLGNYSKTADTVRAPLIFIYAAEDITMTSTLRARLEGQTPGAGSSAATRWLDRMGYTIPATALNTSPGPNDWWARGAEWGGYGLGVIDQQRHLLDPGAVGYPTVSTYRNNVLPDYMSDLAGKGGITEYPFGPAWGYGNGGSGPRGGGNGSGASNVAVAPAGIDPIYAQPAAPGGAGGIGQGPSVGVAYSRSASGGGPGGVVILVADGDMDLTGGTVNANGSDGADNPTDSLADGGGGGGGTIKASCRGTMDGGTLSANGGTTPSIGVTGGGGIVVAIRSAVGAAQTLTATGANAGQTAALTFSTTDYDEAKKNGFLER